MNIRNWMNSIPPKKQNKIITRHNNNNRGRGIIRSINKVRLKTSARKKRMANGCSIMKHQIPKGGTENTITLPPNLSRNDAMYVSTHVVGRAGRAGKNDKRCNQRACCWWWQRRQRRLRRRWRQQQRYQQGVNQKTAISTWGGQIDWFIVIVGVGGILIINIVI